MKRYPNVIRVLELIDKDVDLQEYNGRWIPARPLGLSTIKSRLRISWGVFTGKYDALEWPDEDSPPSAGPE